MWDIIKYLAVTLTTTMAFKNETLFRPENLIYSSSYNITKILAPVLQNKMSYLETSDSDVPTLFFTVSDKKYDGGSCVYVLEDFTPYEVLEGGRDCTTDYSSDSNIYIGSNKGIYKYDPETMSAKKFGAFSDDIIQIQKANGSDIFFILTTQNKMYKLEKKGTIKSKITEVICALQFVIDVNNNIYYVECVHKLIHIIKANGISLSLIASMTETFKDLLLLRPAFIMDNSIPFIGDGTLHVLYANGTCQKTEYQLPQNSAFSFDTTLYVVVAIEGKIYEFNVLDDLIRSIVSADKVPSLISNLFLSVVDGTKEGVFGIYRDWYK